MRQPVSADSHNIARPDAARARMCTPEVRNELTPAMVRKLKQILQKILWVYRTRNFAITDIRDFQQIAPALDCSMVPITPANCERVREFRDASIGAEYRNKLARQEVGFFAESQGRMVGSIWATLNRTQSPVTARGYMRLMPGEGLIHDIVAGEQTRGRGVGPYMLGNFAARLLAEYRLNRIVIDVGVKNRSSLRMMEKIGLRSTETMLYVSAFGTLLAQTQLRRQTSEHACEVA